jgi:hypothetical protein
MNVSAAISVLQEMWNFWIDWSLLTAERAEYRNEYDEP